ncbi:MAG: lipoprotein-releasing ABC transporter permease subunit [Neomegalonema sp.]|nr:lipoprotein-releasing ABC transporter permease subunit [Neomegalonema sp.]
MSDRDKKPRAYRPRSKRGEAAPEADHQAADTAGMSASDKILSTDEKLAQLRDVLGRDRAPKTPVPDKLGTPESADSSTEPPRERAPEGLGGRVEATGRRPRDQGRSGSAHPKPPRPTDASLVRALMRQRQSREDSIPRPSGKAPLPAFNPGKVAAPSVGGKVPRHPDAGAEDGTGVRVSTHPSAREAARRRAERQTQDVFDQIPDMPPATPQPMRGQATSEPIAPEPASPSQHSNPAQEPVQAAKPASSPQTQTGPQTQTSAQTEARPVAAAPQAPPQAPPQPQTEPAPSQEPAQEQPAARRSIREDALKREAARRAAPVDPEPAEAAPASAPYEAKLDTRFEPLGPEELEQEALREKADAEANAAGAAPPLRRPSSPARPTAPFAAYERMMAGRYLRGRRKEGFISVISVLSLIGITLAVGVLIVVMSVMNGFRAELVDRIVGVSGHINAISLNRQFDDYDAVARRIRAVPGVVRAAPLIEGQVLATGPGNSLGVLVRGVRQEDLMTLDRVAQNPEQSSGSLSQFNEGHGIAIGQRLAFKLRVGIGDKVTLTSPKGPATPFGTVFPRSKTYRVDYIFKVGLSQYDEGIVFMPLEEAQLFFLKEGRVDGVEVMVANPEDLTGYRSEIEAAAGRPLLLTDWQQDNLAFLGALRTERMVMFLILSMLIAIASLIIVSGMVMLVKEKRSDIAILRTMGMTSGAVMRVFFMCGATLGLVGTAVGVALGLLFCHYIDPIADFVGFLMGRDPFPEDVYLLSRLPAKVHTEDVLMTIGIALSLSFLATLYPAWKASSLDPVEALRYE